MKTRVMPNWAVAFFAGVNFGAQPIVVADGRDFALVKIAGHSYWVNGREGNRYVPQVWLVVRKSGTYLHPITSCFCQVATGRLYKTHIRYWVDMIDACDRTGNLPSVPG